MVRVVAQMKKVIKGEKEGRKEETRAQIRSFFNKLKNQNEEKINRLAFTETEKKALEKIIEFANSTLPFHVQSVRDGIGNLYLFHDKNTPILLGSHIDSVYDGGNYDGAVGIFVGLQALRTHKDVVKVAAFRAEESVRFGHAFIGSLYATGQLQEKHLAAVALDDPNKKLSDFIPAINRKNFLTENMGIEYCIETHISQGKNVDPGQIGLVDLIYGYFRFKVEIIGVPAHTGGTPNQARSNPSIEASLLELKGEKIARSANCNITITREYPEKINPTAVPEKIICHIDVRGDDMQKMKRVYEEFSRYLDSRKQMTKLEGKTYCFKIENPPRTSTPVKMNAEMLEVAKDALKKARIPMVTTYSGAGHDVKILQSAGISSLLLFIHTPDGISHHWKEKCNEDDIMLAIKANNAIVKEIKKLINKKI